MSQLVIGVSWYLQHSTLAQGPEILSALSTAQIPRVLKQSHQIIINYSVTCIASLLVISYVENHIK